MAVGENDNKRVHRAAVSYGAEGYGGGAPLTVIFGQQNSDHWIDRTSVSDFSQRPHRCPSHTALAILEGCNQWLRRRCAYLDKRFPCIHWHKLIPVL